MIPLVARVTILHSGPGGDITLYSLTCELSAAVKESDVHVSTSSEASANDSSD